MADNFTANSGSGGNDFASDDIGSVHYPRVKVSHGADGSATDSSTAAPFPVELLPTVNGGLTIGPGSGVKLISAATTNATSVKGSAGKLHWVHAINLNAAVRYLKFYNKATSPTVGTDTPVLTLPIPASTTGAGFTFSSDHGLAFATGIGLALTAAIGDSDTTAVAANEIIVNIGYK